MAKSYEITGFHQKLKTEVIEFEGRDVLILINSLSPFKLYEDSSSPEGD